MAEVLGALAVIGAFGLITVDLAMRYGLIAFTWPMRPTNAAETWALVSAVATIATAVTGVVVAAFAYRGLRSLKLTRQEMVNRATRDAKLEAIHRLEEVASELIPMNIPLLNELSALGIGVFVERSEDIRFNPDPQDVSKALEWVAKIPLDLQNRIRGFLNRLEAWSVYFTTGIADESVAFGPVGSLLRAWVGQYYAVILQVRAEQGSGNFPSIVWLYEAWTAKMDEEQLTRLHRDLVAQLDRQRSNLKKAPALPGIHGADVERV